MLRYTQFFCMELGAECNLEHKECPVTVWKRGGREMPDDMRVSLAVEAYRLFGFRGLIGFHYFNEPTIQWTRLAGLMESIRESVPASRFVLWTNGTILPKDARIGMLEQVYVSDYFGDGDKIKKHYAAVPKVTVLSPNMDGRIQAIGSLRTSTRCLRPLVEFVLDNFGVAHLCCQDWRSDVDLGSVWTHSLGEMLTKRRDVVAAVCPLTMTIDAPSRCLACSEKIGIHKLAPVIAKRGKEWADGLPH
jgi:hypothetical protein